MKRLTIPALLALTALSACQQTPPEPEVATSAEPAYEQPETSTDTTPPASTPPPASTEPEQSPGQTEEGAVPPTADDVARMPLEEFVRRKEAGELYIVDVRSAQYYVAGHIPGAVNIPAMQISSMIDLIPKNKQVVTYCTWTAEQSSAGAALVMMQSGVGHVEALLGGFDAWKSAGYPVQEGMM